MTALTETLLAFVCAWAAWRERRGASALPAAVSVAFSGSSYASRTRKTASRPRYPLVWVTLAVVLVLLAFQEWTGALGLVTDAARHESQTEGWYAQRRAFQAKAVHLVVPITVFVFLGASLLVRKSWLRYFPALCAIFYWLGFAVLQSISFHDMDWMLRQTRAGFQLRTWGNLLGLALVCLALVWAWVLDWWGAKRVGEQTETRRRTT